MDIERMHKWEHQHDDLGVVGPRGRGRGGAGGMGLGGPASRRARRGPSRGGGMHRAARGNVRAAILALLAEQKATGGAPMHGYQMIQELSTRTGGAWRPSPGSVYPTLQLLEDEGLVVSDAPEGKRVFEPHRGRAGRVRTHPGVEGSLGSGVRWFRRVATPAEDRRSGHFRPARLGSATRHRGAKGGDTHAPRRPSESAVGTRPRGERGARTRAGQGPGTCSARGLARREGYRG